jgi:hypothetical protein
MPNVISTLDELFKDYDLETRSINYGKEVDAVSYPTVVYQDREPVSIIRPGKNGPWIAGGACLRWYQGLPVQDADIDVFCNSKEQAQTLIDEVRSYGRYSNKFTSDNATTIDYHVKHLGVSPSTWTIQIITKRYYSNMQEVIDNFDLSVCQVATDGTSWALGKHTAKDIREKNLRMSLPLMPDALKRLVKYWTYGYRPVDGLVEAVQTNPVARWAFSPEEDYR